MDKLVLITGAARSGVAMVGGVVQLCGARGGRIVKVTEFDGRGAFENSDIRESIMRPFLTGIGADITGQDPLPDIRRVRDVAAGVAGAWRRLVSGAFLERGVDSDTFFYASPQTCLVWPVWAAAFPEAQWVVVRRKDEDIISACQRTGYMKAHGSRAGWQRWIDDHKQRFAEMEGLNIREVWPQVMMNGHLGDLQTTIEGLGLNWNQSRIEDFISPILWKGGVFEVKE